MLSVLITVYNGFRLNTVIIINILRQPYIVYEFIILLYNGFTAHIRLKDFGNVY